MVEIDEQELEELRELAADGTNYFNWYNKVDDFLFKELGIEFPVIDIIDPTTNTIEAIKVYAERAKENKDG